ncbi:unnamed protein product, partial [Nesidiocoris tenuis]
GCWNWFSLQRVKKRGGPICDIFFDGENQLVQYFADVFKGFAVASITQMEEVRHIVMRNRAVGLDEAQVTADGRYLQKPVQFNVDDSVHLRILVPQRVRVLTAGEQLLRGATRGRKILFLLGKKPAETLELLKTPYGDAALSKIRVYEWFQRFKNGQMTIEDQPRSGGPSTSRTDDNVEKINSLIIDVD